MSITAITTEQEYEAALQRITELMDRDPSEGTRECDELVALADLVEAWEAEHYPMPPPQTETREMSGPHPTHRTRISMDASSYDEICDKCGATDITGGGWGKLAEPCPVPDQQDDFSSSPNTWAEDRCKVCGTLIGIGWRMMHVGLCDTCRELPKQ